MTQQAHPEWLIDLLDELPDQREPEYEKKVNQLRQEAGQRALDHIPQELLECSAVVRHEALHHAEVNSENLRLIADDEALDDRVRFNAYFVWQTTLWRRYGLQRVSRERP